MFLKINELFPVLMIAKASHEFEMDQIAKNYSQLSYITEME